MEPASIKAAEDLFVDAGGVASTSALRTAIVVDAACDLPDAFFQNPGVLVLPIGVRVGNVTYIDMHNAKVKEQFIRDDIGGKGVDAETAPISEREIAALFVERLVLDYDSVFCLTIASSRSPIYDHATHASMDIIRAARALRQNAGRSRPFQMRVVDTKNAFAAQGVPALELLDLIAANASQSQMRARLFDIVDSTYSYLVPDDLYYLRARARAKGDRSVGLFGATVGNMFDLKPILRGRLGESSTVAKILGRDEALARLFRFCAKQVRRGLRSPHFSVSYGGSLSELRALPGFGELAFACANEGVQLHASSMSITGMINVGQRALAVGFAADEHAPIF